jgi:DNA-binding transcriptional regulator YdaS (Cro superfamily)
MEILADMAAFAKVLGAALPHVEQTTRGVRQNEP